MIASIKSHEKFNAASRSTWKLTLLVAVTRRNNQRKSKVACGGLKLRQRNEREATVKVNFGCVLSRERENGLELVIVVSRHHGAGVSVASCTTFPSIEIFAAAL